jgi:hypothetical protein
VAAAVRPLTRDGSTLRVLRGGGGRIHRPLTRIAPSGYVTRRLPTEAGLSLAVYSLLHRARQSLVSGICLKP